ncbi:MAG: quinoprotein relay system zinc metallohydrolase 2 [Hyphomicrobiaceae bacterium]|nr:quinoprotein relay system zinc metallohydrolase 2 [Hyphomicrobiaceae bacterium]
MIASKSLYPASDVSLRTLPISRQQFLVGAAAMAAAAFAGAPAAATSAQGTDIHPVEIAPGVFVATGAHGVYAPANGGDISNKGFIIGDTAVAVVDTGGTARVGLELLRAIRALTDRPVGYVINTHMHPDHVLGNAAFRGEGVQFVGHHKLAAALSARAERYLSYNRDALGAEAFESTEIVLPTQPIETVTTIDLGGRQLRLEPHRTAHTDNDLTIRDSKTDVAFLGDLIFAGHVPTLDGSIRGWLTVLGEMGAKPARKIVPGHGPAAMDWQPAATPVIRYLDAVASDVRQAIKAGRTMRETIATAAQSERGAWELFDEFHGRNVSAAFAELEWE